MQNPFPPQGPASFAHQSATISPYLHAYSVGALASGLSMGTFGHANPGTRETVIVAYRHILRWPADVSGVFMQTSSLTNGTEFKVRFALMKSQGDIWSGVAATSPATPGILMASTTTGVNFSTGRTNAGGASMRALRFNFDTPAQCEPGQYWILMAFEALYAGGTPDATWTSAFVGLSDTIGYPHEPGTTAFSRNLVYKDVIAGGIDSFAWSSYASLASADWFNTVNVTSFTTNSASKTFTGAIAGWGWNLITRPY